MWKNYKGHVNAGVARARELWALYKDKTKEAKAETKTTDAVEELSVWEQYTRQMDVVPDDGDFMTFINAKPTKIGAKMIVLEW